LRLSSLQLRQFRNFRSFGLEPSEGVTLIRGANGAGKTSLLEAISFVALLKSFRSTRSQEMIHFKSEAFNLRATILNGRAEGDDVSLGFGRGERRVEINGARIVRFKDYYGIFRAVVFSPRDMELLFREPAMRRDWLDRILLQVDPGAHDLFLRYQKTLKGKGALLKQPPDPQRLKVLEAWDKKFVEFGAEIGRRRSRLVTSLAAHVADTLPRLLPEAGDAALSYRHDLEDAGEDFSNAEAALRFKLEELREQELERGRALTGPHLHDWAVTGSSGEVRRYFSRGQIRQLMLALVIAEKRYIAECTGEHPVLLLDDIFSELDPGKVDIAAHELSGGGQVIVTTCQGDLPPSLAARPHCVIDL